MLFRFMEGRGARRCRGFDHCVLFSLLKSINIQVKSHDRFPSLLRRRAKCKSIKVYRCFLYVFNQMKRGFQQSNEIASFQIGPYKVHWGLVYKTKQKKSVTAQKSFLSFLISYRNGLHINYNKSIHRFRKWEISYSYIHYTVSN